ncbi:sugar phosphate isomerase/epimerase family protein [Planctomycetota bacterium]
MKIGITQLCIPGTVEEVAEKTAKWGYEVLELVMDTEGGILDLDTPDTRKKEITSIIEDAGIELVSLVARPVAEFPLFSNDKEVRDKGIERCCRVLDTAAFMDCDTILLVPGKLMPEHFYDEAIDYLVESLQEIGPYAKEKGVQVGIEPVWNKFLVSPMDMLHVIQKTDNPNIGVYIDTGNMVFWNYPEHWIRILGTHIKKIHFKDFKREGMNLQFVPLGEGEVNWNNVMQEIRGAGYAGPVISEVDGDDDLMVRTSEKIKEIVRLE